MSINLNDNNLAEMEAKLEQDQFNIELIKSIRKQQKKIIKLNEIIDQTVKRIKNFEDYKFKSRSAITSVQTSPTWADSQGVQKILESKQKKLSKLQIVKQNKQQQDQLFLQNVQEKAMLTLQKQESIKKKKLKLKRNSIDAGSPKSKMEKTVTKQEVESTKVQEIQNQKMLEEKKRINQL